MRITSVELENWRGIRKLSLPFKAGLNILYGPNEIGKSTVIEALQLGLSEDAHSNKQELHTIVPWNTSIKARVKLQLENRSGKQYRIEKSFPRGEAKLFYLTSSAEEQSANKGQLIAEDKKVNQTLFEILGIDHAFGPLFDLLWIKQGEAINLFDMGKRRKTPLIDPGLKSEVQEIIKEQLVSEEAEAFHEQVQEEYASYFKNDGNLKTARDSKGKKVRDLLDRKQELHSRTEATRAALQEYEEKIHKVRSIDQEIQQWEQAVEQKKAYIRKLKYKKKESDLLEQLELKIKPLRARYQKLVKLTQELEAIESELPAARERSNELARKRRSKIEEDLKRYTSLKKELQEIRAAFETLPHIDEKELQEAESLRHSTERIRETLKQTGINVTVTPQQQIEMIVQKDTSKEEHLSLTASCRIQASRSVHLSYPDYLDIDITGPLSESELKEQEKVLAEQEERLQQILSRYGCTDTQQLRTTFNQYRDLNHRRETVQSKMEAIDYEGLEKERAQLQSQEYTQPELFEENAPQHITETVSQKQTLPEIREYIQELEIKRENYLGQQEELLEGGDLDAITREIQAREQELQEQKTKTEMLEPRELNTIAERTIEEQEQEAEKLQERTKDRVSEKSKLEGELSGNEDLTATLANLEYEYSAVQKELKQEYVTISALRSLLALLQQEKERQEKNVVEPVQQEISRAFLELTGERYGEIELDNTFMTLQAKARTYDDSLTPVSVDALSTGTQEQLSFLFRYVIATYLAEREPQIMVLDDSFVNSDKMRMGTLLSFIEKAADRVQFLIFTCNVDDYEAYKNSDAMIDLREYMQG
jgi:DNA repair exonuclease SbcCD ATPase subunit